MIFLCPSEEEGVVLREKKRVYSFRRIHARRVCEPLPTNGDAARFLPPSYFLSLMARSTSRPASRALIDSRRSCCFFPLANPSSTLAWPRSEK